ncbi:hypothetical protein [Arthrobacter bussei]|uniref:Colicin import membrane protein n=1 Tax=Arthrobacter bussei TaxID=2594179 RepID=A0A7X1TQ38_9MICC|nr:hypothetical protein [Arthrobacter bussei]MPY12265.1 hypothetical protein [Arthrobacter bussei]
MSEADGIDDVVENTLRAGLMAAARIGEQLARLREQEQRRIQQEEEHRARVLKERLTASQAAARAQLEPVGRNDWWDKATPAMVERAHETATAWKDHDPIAAEHAARIKDQVQQRYGIDVDNTGATEQQISAALAEAERARGQSQEERTNGASARADEAIVGVAVAGARREDASRSVEPRQEGWDTTERRSDLAANLSKSAGSEAVQARMIADTHQATHPSAAVSSRPRTTQTAKSRPVQSPGRTIERDGLSR